MLDRARVIQILRQLFLSSEEVLATRPDAVWLVHQTREDRARGRIAPGPDTVRTRTE